jgi:hypothetical protein
MAHWIAYPTKKGTSIPAKMLPQVLEMLKEGIWGVPTSAQMATKLMPGDGLLILVGSPYRSFVGDAVIGSRYRQFTADELARRPAGLNFDHGVILERARIWSRFVDLAEVWPQTVTGQTSNPAGLFFGAITSVSSADAALIVATGTRATTSEDGSPVVGRDRPAGTPRPRIVSDARRMFPEAKSAIAEHRPHDRGATSTAGILDAGDHADRAQRAAGRSPSWLPDRIAHADWGTAAAKRVVATAELADGAYHAHAPRTVGESGGLIERMGLARTTGRTTLLGFDFPIGVPRAYAARAGIYDFAAWLRAIGLDAPFFAPADDVADVSPSRPFFPARPPTTKSPGLKAQFLEQLGVPSADLLRRCDRRHCSRRAASEMFWAIGAAAVAKATIAGLRDTIRPALAEAGRTYAIWPFDGELSELLNRSDAVVVETYPTEAYLQLELQMGTGGRAKTSQTDRLGDTKRLLDWCADNAVIPDAELLTQMLTGFGASKSGEDLFDAVVGLFGMIDTVRRAPEPDLPDDADVRQIEGWMFGQHAACPAHA